MGKMGEFAGCCLESGSVGLLGQGGSERRSASDASSLDEHFTMVSTALLNVLLLKLPQNFL